MWKTFQELHNNAKVHFSTKLEIETVAMDLLNIGLDFAAVPPPARCFDWLRGKSDAARKDFDEKDGYSVPTVSVPPLVLGSPSALVTCYTSLSWVLTAPRFKSPTSIVTVVPGEIQIKLGRNKISFKIGTLTPSL